MFLRAYLIDFSQIFRAASTLWRPRWSYEGQKTPPRNMWRKRCPWSYICDFEGYMRSIFPAVCPSKSIYFLLSMLRKCQHNMLVEIHYELRLECWKTIHDQCVCVEQLWAKCIWIYVFMYDDTCRGLIISSSNKYGNLSPHRAGLG